MGVGTIIKEAFYGATPGAIAYELYHSSKDAVQLRNMNPDPLAQQQHELASEHPTVDSALLGICYEHGCNRFRAGRALATGVALELLAAAPLAAAAYAHRDGALAAMLTIAVRGGLHHRYRRARHQQTRRMAYLEDMFEQSGA